MKILRKIFLPYLVALSFLVPVKFLHAVPAEGHQLMVTGPTPVAVEVAKKVFAKGGNVVDVTVAMGLALAVSSPYFASFGGGGFALIKMNGQPVEALDFRETAPGKTHKKYFLGQPPADSEKGPHAIGVPGVPAGLWAMHKKYGKLHWSQLFDEPIRLAEKGFQVSGEWVDRTKLVQKDFNPAAFTHLFKPNKVPYKPGERLKQQGLAKALKQMRNRGPGPFYEGEIGQDLVDTITKLGGVMTRDDLKKYQVRWLKPLTQDFVGHKVYFMPPPSSGGVVLMTALGLVEKLNTKQLAPLSVDELHMLAEIMKVSFRGRLLLGDPDFTENPIARLTGQNVVDEWAAKIKSDKVLALEPLQNAEKKESTETTHYAVMDAKGNAVTVTTTLNSTYGAKVVSEKFGIALNNEMNDFTTDPSKENLYKLVQGDANLVEPGKRPLSSMTPTLVEKNGKIHMALGAQGGSMIISGVFQTLYRNLINGFNMDQAIQFPRIHHQFQPNHIFAEDHLLSPEVLTGLRLKGHVIEKGWQSKAYGIKINSNGFLEAAFDYRNEGGAGGY